jgi:hypothetical protein
MSFTGLVTFYKLAWSYVAIDTSKGGLINEKMIDDALVTLPFPVPLIRAEQYALDQIRDLLGYKLVMNIKEYFSFFQLDTLFNDLNLPGTQKRVYYATIQKGFARTGLWYCEKILGRIRDGTDAMGQALYNY